MRFETPGMRGFSKMKLQQLLVGLFAVWDDAAF